MVAGHIRHAAAAGLIESLGGSPDALRLIVEFGRNGEIALKRAGPDAADVVFNDFDDPALRRQAVRALAEHGPMALADARQVRRRPRLPGNPSRPRRRGHPADRPSRFRPRGAGIIWAVRSKRTLTESLALAALFASGDNGQATIRTIKNDGLERVAQLDQTGVEFYQFLPLYDVIHLGNVLRKGYAPTMGETTWAWSTAAS